MLFLLCALLCLVHARPSGGGRRPSSTVTLDNRPPVAMGRPARGFDPVAAANDKSYCEKYGGIYRVARCRGCNTCSIEGRGTFSQQDYPGAGNPPPQVPQPPRVPPRTSESEGFRMANDREYCESQGGTYFTARCMGCNYCRGPNGNNYSQKDYPKDPAPASPAAPLVQEPQWKRFRNWCELQRGELLVARCPGCSRCIINGRSFEEKDF